MKDKTAGLRLNVVSGLALLAVVSGGVLVSVQEPQLMALALPPTYLAALALILFWILRSSREGSPGIAASTSLPRARASDHPLASSDILGWEFEYARSTASEAMSDRQTMVNFYLAIAGALPTAVVLLIMQGPGLDKLPGYHLIGAAALWVLVVVGWIFFLKMVRLRQAWFDSALAMGRIKEFYLDHVQEFERGELSEAFLWKPGSLPKAEKKWTVFFLSATLIAFLNSLSYMMGSLLLDLRIYSGAAAILFWATLSVFTLLMFFLHMFMYTAFLKKDDGIQGIAAMSDSGQVPIRPNRRVEVLEEHRDFESGLFKMDRVCLRFERFDGTISEPVTRLVFERGDSVCVLLYDAAKDAVLLIQQFRYPAYVRNGPGWLWEIVAGVQDRGRDLTAVAHAELLEEAGHQVGAIVPLMSFYPSPGGTSERIHLYLGYITAHSQIARGGGLPTETEDIAMELFSLPDAIAMIESGQICDAKTVVALQWLSLHKSKLPHMSKTDART
jgi:nudix-type nucleoside diphosphatase (YffH/AdpP family)